MREFRWIANPISGFQGYRMSDPSELHKTEPHPVSSHRTPREIAEDEAGPIGEASNNPDRKVRADQGPVRKLGGSPEEPPKSESESDRH